MIVETEPQRLRRHLVMIFYANLCIFQKHDITTGLAFRGKYKFYCCCFAFVMYCPVYGCNSRINKIWVDFCKRNGFVPSKYSGLWQYFSEDAYVTSHSPQFLSTINFQERRKIHLKPDAVSTKKKPLDMVKGTHGDCRQAKRHTGVLARRKVSTFQSIIMLVVPFYIKNVVN